MHVANVELLIDVGEFPAGIFEEEFADENESACKEVQKQGTEKDRECPAVFVKKERTVRDKKFQFAHEIEGDSEQKGK